MSIKRLHYYNHQFLDEKDFRDEQLYHIEMRRRLNRSLHFWGVVDGLQVARSGNREITVEPGFALDNDGRELVVLNPITRNISYSERHARLHVLISHKETWDEADRRTTGGVEGYVRVTELVEVGVTHELDKSGAGIVLATLHMDTEGNIAQVDHAGRRSAGSLLAPHSVRTNHLADACVTGEKLSEDLRRALEPAAAFELADNSVTEAKLSPELRASLSTRGWIRLPFKPLPIRPKGHRPRPDEGEFMVEVAYAHCDQRGARGTMGIPVPPGATGVRQFRMAGRTKGRKLKVHLYRTGWNPQRKDGEFSEIFNHEIYHAEFDQTWDLDKDLDAFHTLSLAVFAEGEAEVWLVSARFE